MGLKTSTVHACPLRSPGRWVCGENSSRSIARGVRIERSVLKSRQWMETVIRGPSIVPWTLKGSKGSIPGNWSCDVNRESFPSGSKTNWLTASTGIRTFSVPNDR